MNGYKRITAKEINTDGAVLLIGAVIKIAAEDYRKALLDDQTSLQEECERFFLGRYFESLTDLNGQALVEKIRRDTKKEKDIPQKRRYQRRFVRAKNMD